MSGAKRLPSSSVKKATAIGRRVATPCCSSVSTTSSPASTPRLPSKRPPVATVSMCEPHITGAAVGSVPGRVATTLPIASIDRSMPRSRIHPTTRSRPARSASLSARRAHPSSPFGPLIAPISPSSTSRAHNRAPSTRSSVSHPILERCDLAQGGAERGRPRRRTARPRARPSPPSDRRCGRRRRSRWTASRTTPGRRSGRSGCRRGARGSAARPSTCRPAREPGAASATSRRCHRGCPCRARRRATSRPGRRGTPGWARNVIRPWCRRSSRLATPTRALLPPWPLRNTSRSAGVMATQRPRSSSTASSVDGRQPHGARRPRVLVRLRVRQRRQQPGVDLVADRGDRRLGDALGDEQVGVEREVRSVLLDGPERLHDDAARTQAAGDVGRPEMGEVAIDGHARTLPAGQDGLVGRMEDGATERRSRCGPAPITT